MKDSEEVLDMLHGTLSSDIISLSAAMYMSASSQRPTPT